MKSFIAALRNIVLPWGRTTGRRIVLDGDNGAIYIYDAANNRVVLLTSQTPPGLVVGAAPSPQVQVVSVGNLGRIIFVPNSPAAGTNATITEAIFNSGTPTENISLQFQGPSVIGATDRLELLLNSQNTNGSSEANYLLRVGGGPNLMNGDRTNGFTMFRRLALSPPASAVLSAFLIAGTAGQTAPLIQTQTGAKAMLVNTYDGRLGVFPDAVASPAFLVDADTGFTGDLLDLGVNGVQLLGASSAGVIDTYAGNGFNSYTPVLTGGGGATFSSITGWWMRLGKMIFFNASFLASGAGAGATAVSITAPTNIHRGARQRIGAHCSAITGGAGSGEYTALCFTGGAGATIDRLTRGGVDLTAANISATANLCVEGWYREA